MNILYLLTVFTITLINYGECLKCYNCISTTSGEGNLCKDPFANKDKLEPQECDILQINRLADQAKNIAQNLGNAFGIDIVGNTEQKTHAVNMACQKVVTKAGDNEVIIRSCQISSEDNKFCKNVEDKASNSVINHCSLCTTDGCNSSNWLTPFSFLTLLLPLFGLKLWTIFTVA